MSKLRLHVVGLTFTAMLAAGCHVDPEEKPIDLVDSDVELLSSPTLPARCGMAEHGPAQIGCARRSRCATTSCSRPAGHRTGPA